MTTYPLSNLGVTVDANGISAPPYNDLLLSLQAIYTGIYGEDCILTADSQDGQFLAALASALNDTNQGCIATYNQFSPATAVGNGLASVVKINGLKKLVSSNSSVDLAIVGQAGTQIVNGVIGDENGFKWALQPLVTIPPAGSLTATAICTTIGSIAAGTNTVFQILTPTRGWQTATNPAPATAGAPVEGDDTLRQRQSLSTEDAAHAILGAIVGTVRNLPGVQDVTPYVNDTGITDDNGIPKNSIALVVNGGDSTAIAQAIESKKAPGDGTYGTTSVLVQDPNGVPITINFFRPTGITISVSIGLKALNGYVASTGTAVVNAVAAFINGLGTGGNDGLIARTAIYGSIYGVPNSNTFNITSLLIAISPGSPSAADIDVAFNERPATSANNITLAVT